MLDEKGIRALLPQPRSTPPLTTLPASQASTPSAAPPPPPIQATTIPAVPQTLPADRELFDDPMEKITYDAVTGAPGQEDIGGMGAFGGTPVDAGAQTGAPDVIYDLSQEAPGEAKPEVRWKLWVILIAILVAFLLCLGVMVFRNSTPNTPNTSMNYGYGSGGGLGF